MKLDVYVILRDLGDGSQLCKIVGTEENAIKDIGFSSKEEMQEKYSCWYDDGGFAKLTLEVEEKDGKLILIKGGSVSTDEMQMDQ